MVMVLSLGVKAGASSFLSSTLTYVTPLKPERGSRDWRLALGGVLVGFGIRLSSGCTSGHGICGAASFSRASLLAVAVFMAAALAVTTIGFRLAPRLRQTTLLELPTR
ncbi:YeeE/YedE thiosulfate transporter family protein [Synechococcus sp. FACHB-909]|uniref:YeeE/YedE family protein n=1 Tax=Synechococcus sp. FACHB-909 TaxID=2692863 RepID=UPI001688EC45|nr:YeeE/YedE thiosulfate transporter family protein [Synechococcus sp. FACHB-909]MBD2720384.1 YeeE/YedE family protein [Synechococcus sp. FACHB-909]